MAEVENGGGRTVRMSPDELPDPAVPLAPNELPDPAAVPEVPDIAPAPVAPETPEAPEAPEVPDPNATQLCDPGATVAAPTSVAARAARIPSVEDPAPSGSATPVPDGIDALSDPYFSPAAPEDLTEAQQVVSIQSPVESLSERKRRMSGWLIALIVVLVLAAAGGVAYLTYSMELWGGKTLPSVVGLSEQEARTRLESAGFSVEVEYRMGDENVGMVFDVRPSEGTRADASKPVTIFVTGERLVPEVVGMTEEEATQALYDVGAADILVTRTNSEEEPGTVLAVDPPEGSAFASGDQITLTVAQPFTVPDVMGMTATDALALLESQNIVGHVTYVDSDEAGNTVVDVDPSVGAAIEPGTTVELSVSSPYPSEPTHLVDYFETAPEDLSAYLGDEGFSLVYGARYAHNGNAHAVYKGESGDMLHITDDPETAHYAGTSTGDVLAEGSGVGGVRYAFSAETLPEDGGRESEEGVRAVMEACGFEGLVDTCTQDDITVPEGVEVSDDYHFICAYGQQGDYTWAIRIGGSGESTGVVAMVAPTSHFESADLSLTGGSACDYIAYIDLFTG